MFVICYFVSVKHRLWIFASYYQLVFVLDCGTIPVYHHVRCCAAFFCPANFSYIFVQICWFVLHCCHKKVFVLPFFVLPLLYILVQVMLPFCSLLSCHRKMLCCQFLCCYFLFGLYGHDRRPDRTDRTTNIGRPKRPAVIRVAFLDDRNFG